MTHIIHRSLVNLPTMVDHGNGIYLYDKSGKEYIDASSGAAVSCLGHNNPVIQEAIIKQLHTLEYAHTSFFTSEPAEQLADFLAEVTPGDLNNIYFLSGGSEANETAFKLARQYYLELGQPERKFFVSRKQSYHGNTLSTLAVGGNEQRRAKFAPLLIHVEHVSPCFEYRDKQDNETTEQYTDRLVQELEDKFLELGPQNVISFVAETIVGSTTGAVTATPGYFKKIRALCDKYGILIISDEVMCGMGRTGTLHAFEQEEFIPDILTIAKGLGGAYQPIGAVIATDKIVNTIRGKSGVFQHGHTYIGHPIATAAALAVQHYIVDHHILDNVKKQSHHLFDLLRTQLGQQNYIGDIRGRGLFIGIELVKDKSTKAPFDPALKLATKIKQQCFKNGLLVYPSSGTVDGISGDHILLAPPFIITEKQAQDIVNLLDVSIKEVIASI